MRSAFTEVSDRMSEASSSVAADEAVPGAQASSVLGGRSLDASAFIACSLDRLAARAGDGLPQAVAALALLSPASLSRLDRAAALLSEVRDAGDAADAGWSSDAVYRLASAADAGGREDDAVLLLAILAGTVEGERDGCLGLAVVAVRRKRFDDAQALAGYCLAAEARHPRALCIVGICELERGNVAGAQTYLAAAARIARSNPLFRGDLQAAQRALLLMHLS